METHYQLAKACTVSSLLGFCGAMALALSNSTSLATTIYNESGAGDLADSGLTPTVLSVGLGLNEVYGTTGRDATGAVDRDYFTFTVPAGHELSAIAVLPGTETGGNLSFFAVQAGSQVTVPANAQSAAGLLGWIHYTSANGNILPDMGIPAAGSTGFTPPLGAGDYAFWVQELSTGEFDYGFDFQIQAASVPDSGPGLMGGAAVLGLLALGTRKRTESLSGA